MIPDAKPTNRKNGNRKGRKQIIFASGNNFFNAGSRDFYSGMHTGSLGDAGFSRKNLR